MPKQIIVGSRVRKRGYNHLGTVQKMNGSSCKIEWDEGILPRERPKICHVQELELIG